MCLVIGGNVTYNSFIAEASKPIVYEREPEPPREVLIEVQVDWTKERILEEIETQAQKYGVSAEVMKTVIECESMGSTTIQSYHKRPDGSRERSFGLVQIFLDAHPHITREEAIDPQFAIEFLAKNLKAGRGNLWSCYRMNY